MAYFVYFFITLAATAIGALTGMGGGVIIKPVLDALGDYNAVTINILSSITVFVMAFVSFGKQLREKVAPDPRIAAPFVIGSLIGGYCGQQIFAGVIAVFRVSRTVIGVQNICLAIVILVVFLYMSKGDQRTTLGLQGAIPALLTGMLLGVFSAFLGIGGGPINVALLIYTFSYNIKNATSCSIIIILFAQMPKLASTLISGDIFSLDISVLIVMVVGAVIGGWVGSHFNKLMPEQKLDRAFSGVQVLVFVICLFNIFNNQIF